MKPSSFLIALIALAASNGLRADVILADFEADRPVQSSSNVTADRIEAGSPQGRGHLRLTMLPDGLTAGSVQWRLPAGTDFEGRGGLVAQMRVTGGNETKILRWVAFDEQGRPIFQRRFELKPGEAWIRLEEPLRQWRWHDVHPGDWSDVRQIGLRIETPTAQVEVDDVRLVGTSTPAQRTDWLLRVAFEDRPVERMETSDLLVATDAVDAFSEADLSRLLDDMARVRAWVKRVFGDTVRPIDGEGPVMLLIFKEDSDRQAFFKRLGEQWRATLGATQAQGFTVQDICSSTYDPAQGPRRPVYLHESVHGIVARELRLPVGYPRTSPLQEGLANYLQLCVHPRSLGRATFTTNFNRPIDPAGKGFFKPLRSLFDARPMAEQYAQLASVVAYLVERDPKLLRDLAAGLSDGQSATDILARRQTDWQALERAWLEWGRQAFPADSSNLPVLFALPQEFQQ